MEKKSVVVQLPSRGYPYAGRLPEGKIDIFPMTVKEWKLLATSRSNPDSNPFDEILNRCVKSPFDHQDLTLTDRVYLMLYLRIVSYGNTKDLQLTCGKCGADYQHTVQLDKDFDEKLLDESFAEPFSVTLPFSKEKVGLRLLRGRDEQDLISFEKQLRRVRKGPVDDDMLVKRISRQIVSVDGKEIQDREKDDWVEGLIAGDVIAIRKKINDTDSGVTFEVSVRCPSCSALAKVDTGDMTSPHFFFQPDN